MKPVQPGWVIVPVKQAHVNEWYHLVGWKQMDPVVGMKTGAASWREQFGEDLYCIATLDEWVGPFRVSVCGSPRATSS